MNVEQTQWTAASGWTPNAPGNADIDPQLVLVFADPDLVRDPGRYDELRAAYPRGSIVGCSTAGEIATDCVHTETIVVSAIEFATTGVEVAFRELASDDSRSLGASIGADLPRAGLRHVITFTDGTNVNGSEFVEGLTSELGDEVTITGGLAADRDRFETTHVRYDERVRPGAAVAVGLYGEHLRVGCGCLGGWDPFGPERVVTRSVGNDLYELDGRSALALYKDYLGDATKDLPLSAFSFPLAIRRDEASDISVVRTVVAIDDENDKMTFAGSVPEGSLARLMKGNYDRLIEGALNAATTSTRGLSLEDDPASFALLVSCMGRRYVLKQRIDEEIEGVRSVLGPVPVLGGFYAYGEISPIEPGVRCELHNHTMTITTFREAA